MIQSIDSEPSGVRIAGGREKPTIVQRYGPDSDAIDAIALTLRLFIQDSEPISLANMADLYTRSSVSQNLAERFSQLRAEINQLLDSYPLPPIFENGVPLTRRTIFETFLWGDLAHTNNKKRRAMFENWREIRPAFPLLENELCVTLVHIVHALLAIRTVNEAVIRELTLPTRQ